MIARIVFCTALVAAPQGQTARVPSTSQATPTTDNLPGAAIPRHIAEPIVIRDSSVKIDIYSTSDTPVVIEKPDTIVANGANTNKGTLLVPTRVVPVKGGPGRKTPVGKLRLTTAVAHPMISIRRYVYEVERFERDKFIPYAELEFQYADFSWRISPRGPNPLQLIGCGAPVALSGAWANHFQSTCEFGYRDLHLRLGSVTIERSNGVPLKMDLGTGCSEFRIEPIIHPPHRLTFDHSPCSNLRLDPKMRYPAVKVKGAHPITAIDVSIEKVKQTNPARLDQQ
jgi:hypothetical protein